jgi:hypothetical protein
MEPFAPKEELLGLFRRNKPRLAQKEIDDDLHLWKEYHWMKMRLENEN